MRIEDYMKKPRHRLPKLGRVVEVDLDVLRCGVGEGLGVTYDNDAVVKRKVRRVMDSNGWRWQLARQWKDQEVWDYCFEQDKEMIVEINYEFGLIK
ncbi:hypothetical protein H2241_16080 [Pantoea ananatis]|uniref:hypothetical protein n=1 Tax=Pantoea ananas TaxID=553 RepID=UPI00158A1D19|nr:hypothetical protein [Pantoea ananatis]MBA4822469.1 hypothetical protein [Pantoea ananatis]QKV87652.1 hypothetical protein FOB88_11175 [Pantoea ananatis]